MAAKTDCRSSGGGRCGVCTVRCAIRVCRHSGAAPLRAVDP
ncbi:MAG: hypothetical protein ACPHQ9_03835 [Marinobacter sp.]